MKNKGFTLVEMLIVATFLAVIIVFAVPSLTNTFKKANTNEYQRFLNDVFLSAEAYVQKYTDSYSELRTVGEKVFIPIENLLESKYLKSTLFDPKNEKNIKDETDFTVEITRKEDGTYGYKLWEKKVSKINCTYNDVLYENMISETDIVPPTIESKIIGNKIGEWYTDDKVILELTVTDYFLSNCVVTEGGSGINDDSIVITDGEDELTYKKVNDKYIIELTSSKEHNININISDNLKNNSTTDVSVKVDNKVPTITAISSPLGTGDMTYAFKKNIKANFGPSGGEITCDPAINNSLDIASVTCVGTSNNGKQSNSITFNVNHSYAANAYTDTCYRTEQYNCGQKCGAWIPNPQEYCCGACGSICCEGDSVCGTTSGYKCDWYYNGCDTRTVPYSCTKYNCPNGGTLSGTTCVF